MKQVLVETTLAQKIPYMLIENFDDLAEYSETLGRGVDRTISRLMRSDVKIERWDHMIGKNDPDGVMGGAIVTAQFKGTNPLYEVGPLVDSKIRSMLKFLDKGHRILVNTVGGYCPFTEGYHTIIEESEYVGVRAATHVISKDTRYINLENDPILEEHTKDYLGSVDSHYSYICELRNYNHDELVDVFKRFISYGGTTVYVYTTGMDVPQMHDYSKAIIESGLKFCRI